MKRLIAALAILIVALATLSGGHQALAGGGNGTPSGPHYDLNIHGNNHGGSNSLTGNGHDIWVNLKTNDNPNCDIYLTDVASGTYTANGQSYTYSVSNSSQFQVIIPNCNTSPTGYVLFYIPAAAVPTGCATATTGGTLTCSTPYQVWARQLTKGSGSMTTCYTDTTGTFCNTGMTLSFAGKTKGVGPFVNATNSLLFYCQAPAGTTNGSSGSGTTAPIFQDPLANYFWDYDTTNLRLVQLRFYPMPAGTTTTTNSSCTFGPMP